MTVPYRSPCCCLRKVVISCRKGASTSLRAFTPFTCPRGERRRTFYFAEKSESGSAYTKSKSLLSGLRCHVQRLPGHLCAFVFLYLCLTYYLVFLVVPSPSRVRCVTCSIVLCHLPGLLLNLLPLPLASGETLIPSPCSFKRNAVLVTLHVPDARAVTYAFRTFDVFFFFKLLY